MAALGRAATADDILVSLHPRRLGIIGDGLSGDPSALILDNVVIASGRGLNVNLIQPATGLGAAGAVTLTKAVKGDKVVSVIDTNTSPFVDVTSSFESVITVTGQIQETASVSSHGILVYLSAQS